MKIQAIEQGTNKPFCNKKIQVRVQGRNDGNLSYTTDAMGYFNLDEKYKGQQIAHSVQGGAQSQWITASEGAKLYANGQCETSKGGGSKATQTTPSYK